MPNRPPESDWKAFRKLRDRALDTFCKQVLAEAADLLQRPGPSAHEQYRALYALIEQRDKALAQAFDGQSRSIMISQLAHIHRMGLINDEDLACFTEQTQETLAAYRDII